MNIGLGQLLILALILLLFFGNLPKITKDLIDSLKQIKEAIHDSNSKKTK